ncbi:flagellar hook protein [Blastococcus sp. CT_GayMR19]|uniref:flagellin N-terminal helical domain-containing protein n=1 Tax=Blastococcus sp. CT_GayMR19 TaxID=2559608 RepID=UPI001073610E|nr:flagellar hook protein [Blastococcus sp. CT_GayMR19]TFV78524.1 flagellar hook protein [Blastococcus sp. CT_GayMR19]
MRITQRAVALTSLQGLNRNLDAVGKLQQQLTSGRLISAPSDSPTGTNRAMQTRGDQAAVAQQSRNITDARSWLEQTDSALQTMLNATRRVRDLTVQGLNEGAQPGVAQEALATEVASLREGLLSTANLQIQGRPLFGGITSGGKAYDPATGDWAGQDGTPVTRRVSDTEKIRVDLTGPEAFGPPAKDLFKIVDSIAKDLVLGTPGALDAHLADLDAIMNQMGAAVADVGTRASRVETLDQVNFDRGIALSSQLAETEDIDLPNTIMRLQMQQVGYEAALAATAKAIQPSLLDYLR